MIESEDKIPVTPLRKHAVLTKKQLILTGALIGSACALWSSSIIFRSMGIIFPMPFLLISIVLGAFFGMSAAFIADKNDVPRWIGLAVAAFLGLYVPLFLFMAVLLLAGPSDL